MRAALQSAQHALQHLLLFAPRPLTMRLTLLSPCLWLCLIVQQACLLLPLVGQPQAASFLAVADSVLKHYQ